MSTATLIHAPPGEHANVPGESSSLTVDLVHALETIVPRYLQTLRRAVEEAEGADPLTFPQYRCLHNVAARGTTLTTILARHFQVSVPTMTCRLDALVERGLLQRQPDPTSRRQVLVTLTDAGQVTLRRYRALVDARLRALLAPLSDERQARLLAALDDLADALDTPSLPADGEGRAKEE